MNQNLRILNLNSPTYGNAVGYYERARKRTLFWRYNHITLYFPNTLIVTTGGGGIYSALFQIDEPFNLEDEGTMTFIPLPLPHTSTHEVCMGNTPGYFFPPAKYWQSAFVDSYPFDYYQWSRFPNKDVLPFLTKYSPLADRKIQIDFTHSKTFEQQTIDRWKRIQNENR